jgi:hypothetical protein
MTADAKIATLSAEWNELVRERQTLRERGAQTAELEDNRLRIVNTQWLLSNAFVEAHSVGK